MDKPFWTTSKKIAITVALAVIMWCLFNRTASAPPPPKSGVPEETTLPYLEELYRTFNDSYFSNHLPKEVKINVYSSAADKFMAQTICDEKGKVCQIDFNTRYVLAPRVADWTMLHEQCHIQTWKTDQDRTKHGREWRACMLHLDSRGAFREILIDHYVEATP